MTTDRELLIELLEHNKQFVHPGKGKQDAVLVRKICQHLELDEDDFLPRHIRRSKKEWGL